MPEQPGVGSVVSIEDEVFVNLGCPNPHLSMCHAVDGWLAVGADISTTWTEMVWRHSKQLTVELVEDFDRGPTVYDDLLTAWTGPRRNRWYGPVAESTLAEGCSLVDPRVRFGPAPCLRYSSGKDAGAVESIGWIHPSILDPFLDAYRRDPATGVVEHALLLGLDQFHSTFDPALISLVYLRMTARRLRAAQYRAEILDERQMAQLVG